MAGKEKLKEARAVLDERVVQFIKKRAPLTRLMNLCYKPGVKIPEALKDNCHVVDTALRDEAIIKQSLQRLRKAGRIWCNKSGTPHWEICEGADG
jgi:hypothetical protein